MLYGVGPSHAPPHIAFQQGGEYHEHRIKKKGE